MANATPKEKELKETRNPLTHTKDRSKESKVNPIPKKRREERLMPFLERKKRTITLLTNT